MRDAEGARCAIAILVQPLVCDPITRHRHVPIHLNRSGFEFNTLERQTLTCLRGNPVCYVVLVNWCSTDRGPAKEIFVPKSQVCRQIVVLNIVPVCVLKLPQRLLVF